MDIFIQDCVRTPRGKARSAGGLSAQTPYGLVGKLVDALEVRNAFSREDIQSFTLGCVGQIDDQGGHIALTSKIHAQLADVCTAHTINNFCVSGLTAIGMAAASIAAGHTQIALAGGVEMLSRVPFMADNSSYYKAADFAETKRYIPVALAADILAKEQNISRAAMDELALRSQSRAFASDQDATLQRSRIQIGELSRDEAIRPTTLEALQSLRPAFGPLASQYSDALGATPFVPHMTKSHAPPMTDGSGLALLGREGMFETPRARIVGFAEQGGDVRQSLLAGIAAMELVFKRTGLSLADMDCTEFMEAFAPTVAIFERDFTPDISKVNIGGGHIAKGHPMGATGAILLSTLMDALDKVDGKYGLVVVSGAQGVGASMIIERL